MKKLVLVFLIMYGIVVRTFSQATNDAGLWAKLTVEKKMNKRLELFFSQGYRSQENFMRTNLFYSQLGATFKPVGFISVSFSYRAIQKSRLDETFSFRHRLILDMVWKKKFGKFTPSFRQRIQTQVRNVYSSETGQLPEWFARERLEIKYDLDKPLEPYAAMELRYQLMDPRNMSLNGTWNRMRYTVGADYKLNDKNSLSLYYLIQCGFNVPEPQNLYITGISYTLSL